MNVNKELIMSSYTCLFSRSFINMQRCLKYKQDTVLNEKFWIYNFTIKRNTKERRNIIGCGTHLFYIEKKTAEFLSDTALLLMHSVNIIQN